MIESRFTFRGRAIMTHEDFCDPREWARQALGSGPICMLAGRVRLVRSVLANLKLRCVPPETPAAIALRIELARPTISGPASIVRRSGASARVASCGAGSSAYRAAHARSQIVEG